MRILCLTYYPQVIQVSCAMGSNPNDSTRKERVVFATSAMGSNPNDSTRKEWLMLLQIIQKFIADFPSQFQLQDKYEQDCQSMFEDAMLDLLEINYYRTAIDVEIQSALNIRLGI